MSTYTEGELVYVDYGEPNHTVHARLVACHLQADLYVIVTPDHDIYDEELHARNPDYTAFYPGNGGLGSPLPAGLNPRRVYNFGPMTVGEYQKLMQDARTYAAQVRIQHGLPPPGLGNVGAPVHAGPPMPAAPGGAPAPAPMAVDPMVWVALERDHGRTTGEVVVSAGNPLPPNNVTLGTNKALVPMGGGALAVKQVSQSAVQTMAVKDLRSLPLVFDPQGNRRQGFASVVGRMSQDDMPGGGLLLDGLPSTLAVLKSMVARGLTPVTDHEHWVRTHDLPRGDRSAIYEMEVIARALEAFSMNDQLNLPNSRGIELLMMRRWQLIREAHRISPGAPDYGRVSIQILQSLLQGNSKIRQR